MRKIITITYSNIDRTDGPVIHYMELWNSFSRLFRDSFEVSGLACISKPGLPFLITNEFPIETIRSTFPRPLRLLVQDLFFAWRIFQNRRDVIYVRTGNNMFLTVIVAALLGVTLITEYNGIAAMDAESNARGGLFRSFVAAIERLAIRSSAGCIAVSNGIKEFLDTNGARRSIRISNGVSQRFFAAQHQPAGDGKIRVVYVGTFTPWDGATHIADLAKHYPDVEFHMIGDGRLRPGVERSVTCDNVYFKGFVVYRQLVDEYSK